MRPQLAPRCGVAFLMISYALVVRTGRAPLAPLVARTGRPPLGPLVARMGRPPLGPRTGRAPDRSSLAPPSA